MEINNALIEDIIKYLQKNDGHAGTSDIPTFHNAEVLAKAGQIKLKLIGYGLLVGNDHDFTLTQKGWEFESFEKEREKQINIDKLTTISVSSIRFNKYFPLWGSLIALLAVIVPIIYDKCKTKEVTKVELLELKTLQGIEENSSQMQQRRLDSIITILNGKATKDSGKKE